METSAELSGSDYHLAPDSGIDVEPTPITLGDELKIEYRGLLAASGAEAVYVHYGFGPGDWRFVQDIPMEKTPDGTWTAVVQAGEKGRFSFCFRDNANNWDNNNGKNWSYEIHGDDWH
ncbi:MAG: carbohydrate-binding protein [Firmicutes bacterium]|nr:carbohydrate-binding protein [Bacillota bacterium]